MSQAMGTFEQNWTLDCVCDECNHYFSGALELAMGRDSVEAFLRVEYGVKPPPAVNKLLNQRMKATLAAPGVADGARVLMKAIEEAEGMFPNPPPQVGFRQPGEEWRFLIESELSEESVRGLMTDKTEMKILGRHGTDDTHRLVERLSALNIEFTVRDHVRDQPMADKSSIQVQYDFTVDTTLRRAAAKIGFNYAAKVLGPTTMRRSEFDALRRFVRLGEEPLKMVSAQRISVLVGHRLPPQKLTLVHLAGCRSAGN